MRHYLTSLLLLTAASSFAAILTPQQALQRVLADPDGPMRIPGNGEVSLVETFNSPGGQPGVYFFKDAGNGWMVVSASDATDALLGYGDSYEANVAMPPQMQWWLSQYAGQVAFSDSIADIYPDRIASDRPDQGPLKARVVPIAPLLKTKWNQSEPYNLYTPEVDGQKTPTGCVATAMAQVMKYHNYPPEAKGSGSATAGGELLFMDIDKPIAWSDMLDIYKEGEYSDTEAEAVADFMLITGYSVKMQYAPRGSGAYNIDANRAFVENFSYAPSSWAYYRDHYPTNEWKDMLYNELSLGRPIYYSGYAIGGGHAFVCDGVNMVGFYHYNWGWGGAYDGYFAIDALDPGGIGIGGFAGGYNNNQVAFLGVIPPTGNEKMPPVRLSTSYEIKGTISDENMLTMKSGFYNQSYVDADIALALELVNTDGLGTWYSEPMVNNIPPEDGYNQVNIDMSEFDVPNGEYAVRLVTKTEEYPDWLPVLQPYWNPQYVFLTKSGNAWALNPNGNFDGVTSVVSDNNTSDVYTTSGILLRSKATSEDIESLAPGVYIIRNREKAVKININR